MIANSKSGNNIFLGDYSLSLLSQQQDTLTVKDNIRISVQPSDTLKTPRDLNSLFLEIERKSIEIKEQKLKDTRLRLSTHSLHNTKPDTTCFICPKGNSVPFYSLLEQKQISSAQFVGITLYDREYYKNLIGVKGPVFIQTERTPQKTFTESITIKPKPQKATSQDWAIYPTVGILLLLAYIKIFYSKNITSLFRGGIFYFIAGRLTQENSLLWNRLFLLLDSLFFIVIPFGFSLAMQHLEFIPKGYTTFHVFLFSFAILLIFRIFRYISIKAIGLISNRFKDLNHLYFNILLYTRIASILLAPVVVLLAYANKSLTFTLLVFSAVVLGLAIVYRTLRTLQVFIGKGFSLFYLILYLCALEIIPILILAKVFE